MSFGYIVGATTMSMVKRKSLIYSQLDDDTGVVFWTVILGKCCSFFLFKYIVSETTVSMVREKSSVYSELDEDTSVFWAVIIRKCCSFFSFGYIAGCYACPVKYILCNILWIQVFPPLTMSVLYYKYEVEKFSTTCVTSKLVFAVFENKIYFDFPPLAISVCIINCYGENF
jgi:uncharacterized membrane protein YdjX (TVP38/TMEM64 family)